MNVKRFLLITFLALLAVPVAQAQNQPLDGDDRYEPSDTMYRSLMKINDLIYRYWAGKGTNQLNVNVSNITFTVSRTNFYDWGSNCIVAGARTPIAIYAYNASPTEGALLSVSDAPTIAAANIQAMPPWPIAPTNSVFIDLSGNPSPFNTGIVVGLTTNSLAGVTTNVWSTNLAHFTIWYK